MARTSTKGGKKRSSGRKTASRKTSTRTARTTRKATGRKYGAKAKSKVGQTMKEYKRGELTSGRGAKVKGRKQAVAIGLSKARKAGAKVPARGGRGKKKT
ncbi:MAG: DUF6496 domain-containing protein [Myxococcota bacterium]